MSIIPIKRALISVSDKSGIADFASVLNTLNVEIVTTGGTAQALHAAQVPHRTVESLTGLPEMLNGRVKTLHPKIHGGILGKRDTDQADAEHHDIAWIDLVVVNFYPFDKKVHGEMSWDQVVEWIDIGGPTMVRAGAKNFAWVAVITDPKDYATAIDYLKKEAGLPLTFRKYLAGKAFALTARYDAMIQNYFAQEKDLPETLTLSFAKADALRYGENPHQQAYAYQALPHRLSSTTGILQSHQYQGKPLSFNNIMDAQAALDCVAEFASPACVIVKHAQPCGVGTDVSLLDAYHKAYQADPVSAFGGIVACNQTCDEAIAEAIAQTFFEVVIAPDFSERALKIFQTKPNLRVLRIKDLQAAHWEMKFIPGGLLIQENNISALQDCILQEVTQAKPTEAQKKEMLFSWHVLKHVKSNAIVISHNQQTLGIGGGQVSRIDAVEQAIKKAQEKNRDLRGSVLASDAFFPFRDSIDKLAQTKINCIIQPGGSKRDDEVIAACNEHGIAMVFTGQRCFKH